MSLPIALNAVEENRSRILEAERHIWKNPETGYREWKTHQYLLGVFRSLGSEPKEFGNIPGFTVDFETGRPGPRLAIFGEMDALLIPTHPESDPQTGAVHACGHHAQCAALIGIVAGLSAPHALDGLSGSIRLIAVPAEEGIEGDFRNSLIEQGVIRYTHGKKELLFRGILDDVDLAFMIHATQGRKLECEMGTNGNIAKKFTFIGKSAHAADPQEGINALYAANVALNAANALRETFLEKDTIRFHPIITKGGSIVNGIPDCVTVESYIRGADLRAYLAMNQKINRAFAAAAASIGCGLIIKDICGSAPRNYDRGLIDVFAEAGSQFFQKEELDLYRSWDTGCSDFGDITQVMPGVHPHIGGAAGTNHGSDYRIVDPVLACVTSAKVQIAATFLLLQNGACRAKEIIARHMPKYASIKEFLSASDRIDAEWEAVSYKENGDVILSLNHEKKTPRN